MDKAVNTIDARLAGVHALLNPRNVVIVGANDRPGNWTARVWRNLHRYNFPGKVYPLNPSRETIWDVKCYPDYKSLPETPDHLVVLVPAKYVPDALRQAAAAGARSATVLSSGFDEIGSAEGKANGEALRAAIRETGMAVSGPNCMANIIVPASMVTMPDDRFIQCGKGPVAVLGQSGGVVMSIKRILEERGVDVSYTISSGNEDGLTNADYIRYFARDPEIRVIVCYLEMLHDPEGFLTAVREARDAGKPVVIIKLGTSNEGRAAAAAHTGALAGTIAAFDAVAGAAGAIRVTTLDEAVEVIEYCVHAKLPAGPGIGAITLSGALRGLLIDAGQRHGVKFPALSKKSQQELEKLVGVGSSVGNPLDGGFAILISQDTYLKCVELMLADPGIGVLFIQEELTRGPGLEKKEDTFRKVNEIAAKSEKPIVYFSMLSYANNGHSVQLRKQIPNLPFLHETDKAVRIMRPLIDFVEARKDKAKAAKPAASADRKKVLTRIRAQAAAATKPVTLSEPDSKALLKAYGLTLPKEKIVTSAKEAAAAAKKIGFPVVMKGVSADLPHKTEAGAVLIGVASEKEARAGYETIVKNVRKYDKSVKLDGILVAQQITGGLELAIGVSNDPEVGPIVMFGQGGIALELYKDVAFSSPDLNDARAGKLIDQTKAAQLMKGWRGQPGFDRAAVTKALIALGTLTRDLGDQLEAVDVNPFVARPKGKGAVALDALVVLRPGKV
jgi:acyl-CoA synthetase (NDP forming)